MNEDETEGEAEAGLNTGRTRKEISKEEKDK